MASNANMAMTKESILSVSGMLDLPFPAEDIGISYSVFGALFDIAENYATNKLCHIRNDQESHNLS